MKKSRFLITVGLLSILSCTRTVVPEAETGKETEEVRTVSEDERYSPFKEGVAHIYLTEEAADEVERELASGIAVPTRSAGLSDAFRDLGVSSMERLFPDAGKFEARTRAEGLHRWYKIEYNPSVTLTRAGDVLTSLHGIEQWEPVVKVRSMADLPFNDPRLKDQWHYYNDGSRTGWRAGVDINVLPVWQQYTKGSPDVIVAVVDGGIDMNHEDLAGQVIASASRNFAQTANITGNNHGTHVAGTIGAINNNGIGVCGIAGGDAAAGIQGTRLISCQVFDTTADGKSVSGGFENAIKWAADHGAVIANNSWGYDFLDANGNFDLEDAIRYQEIFDQPNTGSYTHALKSAIDYFNKYAGIDENGNQTGPMAGGLVFFSAGNDGRIYGAPANYPGVLAVGAVSPAGGRASYSSFGDWVDIAAPGGDVYGGGTILSTTTGNSYEYMQGTSMACPHMSGVAALVVAACGGPGFTREMLIDRLLGGVNKDVNLRGLQIGSLVDALGAITYGSDEVPAKVTDLKAESQSNNLILNWSVTESEGKVPAYGYLILYGTDPDAVAAATQDQPGTGVFSQRILTGATPVGETLRATIGKLSFETTYYAKVLGYDYNLHYAAPSAVVSATTKANQVPVITAESGSGPFTLKAFENLALTFSVSDPDGHAVTVEYEEGSPAETWLKIPNDKYQLRIVAADVDPGTYTGTVKARDEFGALSTLPISYTVLQNQPPTNIQPFDNLLLGKVMEETRIDLTEYFTDPDGEALQYEIENDNPTVVHLNTDGQTLYITPLKYGLASVKIRALDARKASVDAPFQILVRDPSVEVLFYPNPVLKELTIAPGEKPVEAAIFITTETGQTVFDFVAKVDAFSPAVIDMSNCAPGRYFARVRIEGKEYNQIIIKK